MPKLSSAGNQRATSALVNVEVLIIDLSGTTLGPATCNAIYHDIDAVGWGWFDTTPWDDSQYTTPGNHGEQNCIDFLTPQF